MDTLHFERYEYKYFVPVDRIDDLRRFIRPYVTVDPNGAGRPGNRYTINNLYLDTPGLDLYRAGVNEDVDRFKLRVRWYGDPERAPLFFEVKRKIRQVIVKDRARVGRDALLAILRGERPSTPDGPGRKNLAAFLDRMWFTGAVPHLLLRYTREAYESVFGEYARLSLDRAMCFQPARGWDLSGDARAWTFVDGAWSMEGSRCAALLELKIERKFPAWMTDLVGALDLQRTGFSKYGASVDHRLGIGTGGADLHRRAVAGV